MVNHAIIMHLPENGMALTMTSVVSAYVVLLVVVVALLLPLHIFTHPKQALEARQAPRC